MDVLKPYVLLACVAFVVGFLGYWMLGRALSVMPPDAAVYEAPISMPAPSDDVDSIRHV